MSLLGEEEGRRRCSKLNEIDMRGGGVQETAIRPFGQSLLPYIQYPIITFECEPDAVPLKKILDIAMICT